MTEADTSYGFSIFLTHFIAFVFGMIYENWANKHDYSTGEKK